ncbi:hypothetical protein [Leucobacter chromiireducens]|uniref:hypothetical protein n=1 Tax=Leucobacter chromiireducens TaxID=283877 RepID=UPI0019252E02|nr:hypothetical protein [Leucobacter chromiireducens]
MRSINLPAITFTHLTQVLKLLGLDSHARTHPVICNPGSQKDLDHRGGAVHAGDVLLLRIPIHSAASARSMAR